MLTAVAYRRVVMDTDLYNFKVFEKLCGKEANNTDKDSTWD